MPDLNETGGVKLIETNIINWFHIRDKDNDLIGIAQDCRHPNGFWLVDLFPLTEDYSDSVEQIEADDEAGIAYVCWEMLKNSKTYWRFENEC